MDHSFHSLSCDGASRNIEWLNHKHGTYIMICFLFRCHCFCRPRLSFLRPSLMKAVLERASIIEGFVFAPGAGAEEEEAMISRALSGPG